MNPIQRAKRNEYLQQHKHLNDTNIILMLSMMSIDTRAADAELAVAGGILELEEEDEMSSPLLLRGGGDEHHPPLSSPLLMMPEMIIEQTLQPDGSITIKASTISPHPNGYRDVKIEHYSIPASKAESVDTSPGSPPPSAEYLTRVEYRVLSPGLELGPPDDDASTVYTAPTPHNDCASVASTYTRKRRRQKRSYRTLLLITGVVLFLAVIIGVAVTRDYSRYHQNNVEPSPDPTPTNNTDDTKRATEEVIDDEAEKTDGNDLSPVVPPEHHHHHHHRHNITVAATQ